MRRKNMHLPYDFLEKMAILTDEEYGRLIRAMQVYSLRGEEQELPGRESLCWAMVKRTVDEYERKCRVLRENGKKGGRPKKPNGFVENQMVFLENQNKPNGFEIERESAPPSPPLGPPLSSPPTPPVSLPPYNPPHNHPRERKTESASARAPDAFDAFWAVYPRKVGKLAAKRAFERVNVPLETLVTALRRQKCSAQWTADNGRFIPHPATWLNQGRWEDELEERSGFSYNIGEVNSL